jgi:hypothetical protein
MLEIIVIFILLFTDRISELQAEDFCGYFSGI